jgi:hypothetical protein
MLRVSQSPELSTLSIAHSCQRETRPCFEETSGILKPKLAVKTRRLVINQTSVGAAEWGRAVVKTPTTAPVAAFAKVRRKRLRSLLNCVSKLG